MALSKERPQDEAPRKDRRSRPHALEVHDLIGTLNRDGKDVGSLCGSESSVAVPFRDAGAADRLDEV